MIGKGDSLEHLQKLAEDRNMTGRIVFVGSKEQSYIASHLRDYDLFVQPSRKEGFGLNYSVKATAAAYLRNYKILTDSQYAKY